MVLNHHREHAVQDRGTHGARVRAEEELRLAAVHHAQREGLAESNSQLGKHWRLCFEELKSVSLIQTDSDRQIRLCLWLICMQIIELSAESNDFHTGSRSCRTGALPCSGSSRRERKVAREQDHWEQV